MNISLPIVKNLLSGKEIRISGSKSESNRLLVLQQFFPEITIKNLSDSDDTQLLARALSFNANEINIGHAGTAMRFLTAFFAVSPNKKVFLDGSERMRQRPIKILVDALRSLGADISYVNQNGFPPLYIKGKKISKREVFIDAGISSQYLSALLLIAPALPEGIKINWEGEVASRPYLDMTVSILRQLGVQMVATPNSIEVFPLGEIKQKDFTVESDWSSASYYYSIVALSPVNTTILLSDFKENSFQGDAALIDLFQNFGVNSTFENGKLVLQKKQDAAAKTLSFDLINHPDLAQTMAVTCMALGIDCHLTGLHTLKIKETDRLVSLKTELEKCGALVTLSESSLSLQNPNARELSPVTIATYNDHRMAMAFAPLALVRPISIESAAVVSKSYPNFWNDLKTIGFQLKNS